jgi:hypothetical protein
MYGLFFSAMMEYKYVYHSEETKLQGDDRGYNFGDLSEEERAKRR